jgi:phospholipid transport system substrate-binding protein
VRKLLLCLLALLTVSVSPAAYALSADEARQFVDGVGRQTVTIIGDAALSKEQKKTRLQQLFATSVDIPWVGRFVLGRYWRTASEEQRAHYLKEYQSFITTLYAGRFAEYSGGSYKITGTQDGGEGEFTVSMDIITVGSQQQPVHVEYRVHTDTVSTQVRVFDVAVEGVSLITTQRSEFSSILENKGLDYLIERMANKSLTISNDPVAAN